MKLLKNEADFLTYMLEGEEEGESLGFGFYRSPDELTVFAPTEYPCYCYWRPMPEDDPEVTYLYAADVDLMRAALQEAVLAERGL